MSRDRSRNWRRGNGTTRARWGPRLVGRAALQISQDARQGVDLCIQAGTPFLQGLASRIPLPLLRAACTGYTWVLEQPLEQTSWVAVVLTLKYWGSQKNGWSPSAQEHGQEAHQCFWVAAKMGETLLKSQQCLASGTMVTGSARRFARFN